MIATGLYRHYKGGLYLLLGVAGGEDNKDYAVYINLGEPDPEKPGPRLRVRLLSEFMEHGPFCKSCGGGAQKCCDRREVAEGTAVARFRYVGLGTPPTEKDEAMLARLNIVPDWRKFE